jgi:cytochrome c553
LNIAEPSEEISMKRSAYSLLLAVLVPGSSAFAQPATVQPGSGDDLRAAYATAQDVADGKRVAQSSCFGCHGINGISATKGVPHLAGQRAAYLHLELRNYKAGVRGNEAMGGAVKFLSDDSLFKAAAYYASLDPVQSGAGEGAKSAPARPDPVQAGKAAAASCAGCHGETGVSKMPGTPSLVGLDPKYLAAALKAYKGGQRKSDIMKPMAAAVSDADVGNVTLYYALQKAARAETPAAGDKAAGKAAAAACAGCHGEQGVSATPATPSLAGQDAQYLAVALAAYKSAGRGDETMKGIASSLDDTAMKNLAAYYASLQPQSPNVSKPLATAEWAERCDRCHGINGNSTDPRLPALAGQREDYLQAVLQAYRTGKRKSTAMAAMSGVLTDADIDNLAAHYSRQKARAVVYVTLPAK